MALNIESTGAKAKVPDFKKRGKTKKGKPRPRVEVFTSDAEERISGENHTQSAIELDVEIKEQIAAPSQNKKSSSNKRVKQEKAKKTQPVLPQNGDAAFIESSETKIFKNIVSQLGPVNSMYYLIIKSAVNKDKKGKFQASKNDVAKFLGISSSRANQVLKDLRAKKAIEVLELENSTTQTAKTYRLSL